MSLPSPSSAVRAALAALALVALACVARGPGAQPPSRAGRPADPSARPDSAAAHAVHAAMGGAGHHDGHGDDPGDDHGMAHGSGGDGGDASIHDRHLRLTAPRRATSADSARARALVRVMRDSLARYRDVRVAHRDGYRPFAPNVPGQRVLHYTHYGRAFMEGFRFDPARPTSLLYAKHPDGTLTLVGAMYGAPARMSEAELDARVPLAVARWHLHVNLCVPPLRALERWRETRDGRPLFGPLSPIATAEECRAVGGRFRESVFGWMVHVNAFAGDRWAEVFGGH